MHVSRLLSLTQSEPTVRRAHETLLVLEESPGRVFLQCNALQTFFCFLASYSDAFQWFSVIAQELDILPNVALRRGAYRVHRPGKGKKLWEGSADSTDRWPHDMFEKLNLADAPPPRVSCFALFPFFLLYAVLGASA